MYGLNDIKNPLRVPCLSCPSLCLCSSPLPFPILCLILALQPRLSFTIFLSQPSSLSFFISPFSSLPALLTLFFLFPQYITLFPPLSMTAYFSLVFCISIRPSHFIPLHPSPPLIFFYLNPSPLSLSSVSLTVLFNYLLHCQPVSPSLFASLSFSIFKLLLSLSLLLKTKLQVFFFKTNGQHKSCVFRFLYLR